MSILKASSRIEREIHHGKRLASGDTEKIWGWGTPAGQIRARHRADLIVAGACLRPETIALEIGCGTGMFTAMFAESTRNSSSTSIFFLMIRASALILF
nr:hypothetical protein [Deltaproteobacteria bacterium]